MNQIETFISDIRLDLANPVFVPIKNIDSIQLIKHTLNENENDYLEGGITLIYDSEELLVKEMETTDLIFTWQTLIEPILFPGEKKYSVELLDSVYEIRVEEVSEGYIFHRMNMFDDSDCILKNVNKKEYNELVKIGFLEFAEYLFKHQFPFSKDSSYPTLVENYRKVKKLMIKYL